MQIPIQITWDEEKLKEIVREAVENLKEQGWLYRDIYSTFPNESVKENKGDE